MSHSSRLAAGRGNAMQSEMVSIDIRHLDPRITRIFVCLSLQSPGSCLAQVSIQRTQHSKSCCCLLQIKNLKCEVWPGAGSAESERNSDAPLWRLHATDRVSHSRCNSTVVCALSKAIPTVPLTSEMQTQWCLQPLWQEASGRSVRDLRDFCMSLPATAEIQLEAESKPIVHSGIDSMEASLARLQTRLHKQQMEFRSSK